MRAGQRKNESDSRVGTGKASGGEGAAGKESGKAGEGVPAGSERIPESGAFTSLSGGTVIYRGRLGDKGGEKSPEQGCRCFYPPGKKGRQFMID